MNLQDLTHKIRVWAIVRGLDDADPKAQALKLGEEVGEIFAALSRGDDNEVFDGIGDVFVVMTILAMQKGHNIEACVQQAYDEIKDRTGKMVDGVFVKESDL